MEIGFVSKISAKNQMIDDSRSFEAWSSYVVSDSDQLGDEVNPILLLLQRISFGLSLTALLVSVRLILLHLRHFSQPIIQRKIIAILWMVPLFATTSWLSLVFVSVSMFLDMVRDCYESFVIYMFFALCYCYIGQVDREHIDQPRIYNVLREKGSVQHLIRFPSCLGVDRQIDLTIDPRSFLMRCKRNILQFVLIKPLSTILVIILSEYFDKYEPGNFSLTSGYLYVTTIVNVSISLSMYWLVMFYQATKESLAPFDPVPKFLCIKGVLFFSYWQSVVITILVRLGIITDLPVIHYSVDRVASTIQNALICLEMVGFAIAHAYAFAARPFYFLPTRLNSDALLSSGTLRQPVVTSARVMLRNAVNFSDVVEDLQEVAPEMPLVRYLRRNSTSSVPTGSPVKPQVEVPSAASLKAIKLAHVPSRPQST